MTGITIVRAVQTCFACPSQWDAWTDTGQYLYLRYRYGHGTVDAYDGPDVGTWNGAPLGSVADFRHGHHLDGVIELDQFYQLAGLRLELSSG